MSEKKDIADKIPKDTSGVNQTHANPTSNTGNTLVFFHNGNQQNTGNNHHSHSNIQPGPGSCSL